MKNYCRIILLLCALLFCNKAIFAQKEIVVSQDGTGNFKTIQEAINSLPAKSKTQRVISIKKGTYSEKIFIDKDFVTLKGEDPINTIIAISLARDEWRCNNPDDYGTATINLKGSDITLVNLSFINSYGKDNKGSKTLNCPGDSAKSKTIKSNTHQMALRSFKTTRLIVINCIFRAYGGDTVSPWNAEAGMFYFKNCTMEGGVDFYCPRGWALAENCTFICQKSSAAIWHDGSKAESSKTVLLNCKFSGDDKFILGRYHKDAQFYLLNCNFAKNMADSAIYLVPGNNTNLWGKRVYYFNCHREGGDYSWHKNNLPADFGINEFNVPWVYDYKWNPIGTQTVSDSNLTSNVIKTTVVTDPIAENMLLYQRSNGGWPKHFKEQKVDYNQNLSADDLVILRRGYAEGIDATIDNDATFKEIKYLVKAYNADKNKKYLDAAEKGIAYILKAQYQNGGWPQYYPDFSSYRSEITYNDNAMVNVLTLLDEVVRKKNGMQVINASFIAPSKDAIERGIDCILKTQIKQNGKLTVWCAQYDAKSLLPAKARKYELVSLSGSESVGIVRFLMSVDNPSKEVITAINSSFEWFNKVKIVGFKFGEITGQPTPSGKDKVLSPDPSSTIWARFYTIENNEPFFCGRDGIAKKSVTEIEFERRVGYAWYGVWPAKLLSSDYPAWQLKLKNK